METSEAIKRRRSIRSFRSDPVPDEIIERIMELAIMAPSALNSQNWKFYVLTGKSRDEFAMLLVPVFENMKEKILKNYGPEAVEVRRKLYTNAGNAPVVIVCYVEEGTWDWDPTGPSMACQNILLAATSEGLGSLFMGAPRYVKDSVNEFIGEKKAKLLGAVLMGYTDDNPVPPSRVGGKVIRMR